MNHLRVEIAIENNHRGILHVADSSPEWDLDHIVDIIIRSAITNKKIQYLPFDTKRDESNVELSF